MRVQCRCRDCLPSLPFIYFIPILFCPHFTSSFSGEIFFLFYVEEMIRGLTQVPWERVDVSFQKSKQRYVAHNTIQESSVAGQLISYLSNLLFCSIYFIGSSFPHYYPRSQNIIKEQCSFDRQESFLSNIQVFGNFTEVLQYYIFHTWRSSNF